MYLCCNNNDPSIITVTVPDIITIIGITLILLYVVIYGQR